MFTKQRFNIVFGYLRLVVIKLKLKTKYYLAQKNLVVNHNNYLIRYHNDGDDQELLYLANWAKYFEEEYPILNKLINSGDVVVDVGANLGFFSIIISKIVGEKGNVFSFEPSINIFSKLIDNLKLNSITNVNLENCGLGKSDEILTLKRNKKYSGMSTLVLEQDNEIIEEQVKITSLDKYFFDKVIKIDLIKIDTEGFEPEVLIGAKKIITSYKPVIYIELGGGKFLKSSGRAIKILNDYGYKLPIKEDDLESIPAGRNFVALPK
ncbi:MAG TPA: hypothetical protein DHV28_18565 [Ignavibacteriales bacterium]|nr:hypothetical protein [Ignavibacteriales bacterium]